jgi:DNA N-6-adenine-methyltransferase (Dam)
MAEVNRPDSPQNYRTSPAFLAACAERFGRLQFDAACTRDDAVAPMGYHSPEYDALSRDWRSELGDLTVWCNPPFRRSAAFARKAAESRRSDSGDATAPPRVLLLVPASIDSCWFERCVHGQALVLALQPRLAFVGCATPINRPLMLCVYARDVIPGFDVWRWKP